MPWPALVVQGRAPSRTNHHDSMPAKPSHQLVAYLEVNLPQESLGQF